MILRINYSKKNETPNKINNCFTNIGDNLAKLIKPPTQNKIEELTSEESEVIRLHQERIFKFRSILPDEVELIVKNIETHKSSGIPLISTYFLKLAFKAIIPHLTYLLNTSLSTGNIPPPMEGLKSDTTI